MGEKKLTTAELIIDTLNVSMDRFYDPSAYDPRCARWSELIREKYSLNKRGKSFGEAARAARVEVIELILKEANDGASGIEQLVQENAALVGCANNWVERCRNLELENAKLQADNKRLESRCNQLHTEEK